MRIRKAVTLHCASLGYDVIEEGGTENLYVVTLARSGAPNTRMELIDLFIADSPGRLLVLKQWISDTLQCGSDDVEVFCGALIEISD